MAMFGFPHWQLNRPLQRAAWSRRMNDCRLLSGSNGRSTRGGDVWRDGVNAVLMGLDPNLSIFMSGIGTLLFSLLPAGACPVISVPARLLSRGDCRNGL